MFIVQVSVHKPDTQRPWDGMYPEYQRNSNEGLVTEEKKSRRREAVAEVREIMGHGPG